MRRRLAGPARTVRPAARWPSVLAPARDYAERGFRRPPCWPAPSRGSPTCPAPRTTCVRMACGRATGSAGRWLARTLDAIVRDGPRRLLRRRLRYGPARAGRRSLRRRISRDRSRDGRRRCTYRLSATRSGPCRRPPRATWCSPARGSPTTCRCRRTRATGPGRTCSSEAARWAGHDRPDVLFDGADGAALLAEHRLDPTRAAIDPTRRTAPTATQAARRHHVPLRGGCRPDGRSR